MADQPNPFSDYSTEDLPAGLRPSATPNPFAQYDRRGQPPTVQGMLGDAADLAHNTGTGLVKLAASMPGMPGDLEHLRDTGVDWLMRKGIGAATGRDMPSTLPLIAGDQLPTSAEIARPVFDNIMTEYKPTSGFGKLYQASVSSALPIGGLAGMAKNAVTGMLSEGAGQATEGSFLETPSRFAAALLPSAKRIAMPASAPEIAAAGLEGISPAKQKLAQALMDDATSRGMRLTGAEALAQVNGGPGMLNDVQRVVEQSSTGKPIMNTVMGQRAATNDAGIRNQLDVIAAPNATPFETAPKVQAAAQSELDRVRQQINDKAAPYYAASANNPNAVIHPTDFQPIADNPVFQGALGKVRGDPIYGNLSQLPDNSLPVVDAVKKTMDDMAQSAGQAGERYRAATVTGGKNDMLVKADAAAPDYGTARAIVQEGTTAKLNPLERSPTGQLANADGFDAQRKIILNPNPMPGSHTQVADAVRTIAAKDPQAAADLVRQSLESTFNETSQRLMSGANQWGGAKYASVIAGNPQQARNLEAAIKALPNGTVAYTGFRRMLDVLEAQGSRQAPGSMTEQNRIINETMQGGGLARAFTEGVNVPARAGQWYQNFRYGKNTTQMANLLTDPKSVDKLRALAGLAPGSAKAQSLVAGLIAERQSADDDRRKADGN